MHTRYECKDFERNAEWIVWVDASGWGDGWRDVTAAREQGVCRINSIGFVVREDDTCVVLAQSLDMKHDSVDHVLTIPSSAIRERWTIGR